MTYPTVDAGESQGADRTPPALAAPSTRAERLCARLMLVALASLVAVFWIAVIRLAAKV